MQTNEKHEHIWDTILDKTVTCQINWQPKSNRIYQSEETTSNDYFALFLAYLIFLTKLDNTKKVFSEYASTNY